MTVYNYKSRQVHKTWNGLNPSSGFRDSRSAISETNLCQIWHNILVHGQAHVGQMGNDRKSAQLQA